MKVEIDNRPKDLNSEGFYAIRLYPENNKEFAELEMAMSINIQPVSIERIVFSEEIHYAIIFDKE